MNYISIIISLGYHNSLTQMKNTRTPMGAKFLDRYINKKKLGRGAFGDVYLVEDT